MRYMVRIDVRVPTKARPETIYALLRDGATWPTWSPIRKFELRTPGKTEPEGIGAIRVFRTGTVTSVERITELVPDRRFGYEATEGMPVKDYRATVELGINRGSDESTLIHWQSTFKAKVPGTGWVIRLALGRFIRRAAEGLAYHAEELSEK